MQQQRVDTTGNMPPRLRQSNNGPRAQKLSSLSRTMSRREDVDNRLKVKKGPGQDSRQSREVAQVERLVVEPPRFTIASTMRS